MAEQPLCEDNHSVTCTEEGYFPQHNQMTVMNQSYGVQQSPVSPHFYQDPRESPVTPGQDFSAMWDVSKAAGWPSNHGKNAPDLQGEAMEMSDSSNSRSYQFSVLAHANSEGSSNQPGNVLPRLDSFTQAFSSQSLHILQGSARNKGPNHVGQQQPPGMMASSPGSAPTEGALRQLLFHKAQLDQPNMPRQTTGPQQRYQRLMSSYEQTTAKHTQDPQQPHQLLHYGYQQQQHQHQQQQQQQQRAAHLEHMQKVTQQQQNLQYYLQQQSRQQAQITAHSLSLQQYQQQQQQQPHQPLQHQQGAYYAQSTQSTPHSAEQTMQSPPFFPNYSQNCKVQQQPFIQSDQAHSTQQAQFYFQEQQKYRHIYHQNSHYLHPQQQVQVQVQDEVLALPSEQYPSNSNCSLLSPGQQTPITQSPPSIQGLLDSRQNTMACQEHTVPMTTTSSPLSQGQVSEREVLPTIQLVSSKGGSQQHHHSPSAIWPQMCLPSFRGDPLSPDHSTMAKTAVTEKSDSTKKLLCSICRKEFKSLPALNGHMRSHGGFRALPAPKTKEGVTPLSQTDEPGPPIVMPVSVPVKLQPTPTKVPLTPHWPCLENDHVSLVEQSVQHAWPCPGASQLFSSPPLIKTQKMAAGGGKGARLVKKYRHRPQPLVIPAPSSVPGGVVLFQSRLRSPAGLGGAMPYTPPPMLSPARRGSGLFSSIKLGPLNPGVSAIPATQHVSIGKTSIVDGDVPDSGERCSDVEPRINIGPCFQAEIPDLLGLSQVEKDDHRACMLWTPLGDLNTPASQQKVDDLVKVACSSVLPGGGTNTEYALHCLFECGGNFMATLEKLLMLKPLRHKSNHLVDYHYAGSDKWTILEKKKLNQAIIIHNKDFFLIQKMVRTKTVAQCVEYYYTWKNRLRLGKRQRTCLTNLESESLEGWTEGKLQSEERHNDEKSVQYEHKVIRLPELSDPAANQIADLPNVTFVCEVPNCGSTFSSKQALSGHARIHSSPGPAPKAAVERSKIKSAPQSGQGSVKNSPARSTTSGDTDPTVIFPCKECGKVFFKIKSRNAHMKTHRQPEDPQCWRPQKAPERAHPEGAHGGKRIAKAPPTMPLLQLPFDHRGLVKQLRPEEEEHAEEEDPLLTTPPMLQIETDEMSMSEEL